MKKLKKFLKIFFIILLILIGLLFATPYIFKGKIVTMVKKEVNKNLNAKVDFKEVDISFFRRFPKVSIGLDDLQVIGINYFADDTLLSAKRLDATVDFLSFIRGSNMNINNIFLVSPRINAIVDKDGLANWDIVKSEAEKTGKDTADKPFNLALDYYSIENGYINYMDVQNNISVVVENLNHSGSGDFTADLFTLRTRSAADAISFNDGAIPYLSKVRSVVNTDIKIDNKKGVYSFDGTDISLNELKIDGKGVVNKLANGYGMDISFKSPTSDFKNILSLITPIYQKEFSKVTATGTAIFEGFVKGVYADSVMPAYHLAAEVKDGSFKYTDLPKGVQQINFKILVDNPDGKTDNTVVDITNGHLAIDNEPFDFRLLVKNPVSNMFVDAAAKGKLDLSQVANYVKLEKGTSIAGLMNADVSIKGNVKEIEQQQYNKFYAAGIVNVNNFKYTSADYPTGVKINTVHADFTPTKINVSNLDGQYQNSNFDGGGQINNLLSYLLNGKPLSANLAINADKINLNDWIGVSADTTSKGSTAQPFIVPDNLDVVLNTKIDRLLYDKVDIQNLSGTVQVKDEAVVLNNVNGNAMDGKIKINGSYSTKESKTKPAIAMSYDVAGVDIQKTFYAFNTAQKLMPIGKYLAGKLTSVLSASGKLGDDMNIDMSTISGNGNLFLIEGFLSKFAPLDKMASVLNVKQLQEISLKDVKTFFEFSNGKLLVKPFTVKLKDIEMEIGGLQGFDQSLNYAINLKLPRALMGTQGNQLVNNLAAAINAKGIPVKISDVVNLKLAMGGTFTNPSIKVDLKQSGEKLADQMQQQVKDFAQAKIDSAKKAAQDTLTSIKKQLGNAALEELRKKMQNKKDTVAAKDSTPVKNSGDKTKESVKGLFDNLLKKKPKDTANRQ
ncbi:MAG: AsmA-like C-terminal region-containing protein [Chitinophagaceae bacterium]|nr:AsmA-like C-terminal region-containing protein [Chitinophagaceae bacterium]